MAEDDDCREKQRAASVGAMRVSRLFTIPIISDNQVSCKRAEIRTYDRANGNRRDPNRMSVSLRIAADACSLHVPIVTQN